MPIISGRSKLVCSNNYFTLYRKSKLKQDGSSSTIVVSRGYTPFRKSGCGHATSWKVQCSHQTLRLLIIALNSPLTDRAWDEILHGLGLGHCLRTRLPVYHRHIMLKMYLLFPHNAQCFLVPIIPKLCQHNPPNPNVRPYQIDFMFHGSGRVFFFEN